MDSDDATSRYVLHMRDSSGRGSRLEIGCSSDAEALSAAREQRVDRSVELWQGDRRGGALE
jgi:hypothetical protein